MTPTQTIIEIQRIRDRLELSEDHDNVLKEAIDLIRRIQSSLQDEIARIEKLQPLADSVLSAVKTYKY